MRKKRIPRGIGAWGVLPRWILEHRKLTATAKLLVVALALYDGPKGLFPSLETLAATIGSGKTSVIESLRLLVSEDIVRMRKAKNSKGKQVNNQYKLDLTEPSKRIRTDAPDGFWTHPKET